MKNVKEFVILQCHTDNTILAKIDGFLWDNAPKELSK